MFHVKQPPNKMNKEILLTYTKIPEDHIENILHIDSPKQPSQRMSSRPQIFRRELFTRPDDGYAAPQRSCRFLQQFTLPRPTDEATLA
jgi:hypothetical protein